MRRFSFRFRSTFRMPVDTVFSYFEKPDIFRRLLPPFSHLSFRETLSFPPQRTLLAEYRNFGMRFCQTIQTVAFEKNIRFLQKQIDGFFSFWEQDHIFTSIDPGKTSLETRIDYSLPFPLAFLLKNSGKEWERFFRYRDEVIENDLYFPLTDLRKKKNILITGSGGLVGSSLTAYLRSFGHQITPVTGRKPREKSIFWDIYRGQIDIPPNEKYDAIIHLAGENISGYWSKEKKEKILKSRVLSTRLLVRTINRLPHPPEVFLLASGIHAYPKNIDCTEESGQGTGFPAEVLRATESELIPLKDVRTVIMRSGVVISPRGGMLQKILPLFRAGLGHTIAGGEQRLSWIAIDDLLRIYAFALHRPDIQGVLNITAPFPVSNAFFSKTLAALLRRPLLFRLPEFLFRIGNKEFHRELLLSDFSVRSEKLPKAGFRFLYPDIQKAFTHLLGTNHLF